MEQQNVSKRTARPVARTLVRTTVVGASVTGAFMAAAIAAARAMHDPRYRNAIRAFNQRSLNPLTLRIAGNRSRVYGRLEHTGRRSGRVYSTPVVARPLGDGFVVPLPYGTTTDWLRNVLTAKGCRLMWNAKTYTLNRPELIPAADALPAFPWLQRVIFRAGGIERFLWLHRATDETATATAANQALTLES